MTRKLLLATLLVLAVRLALLPLLPLTDPTEGRYATIGQEMTLGGDWVTPRVWIGAEKIPFLGKPPLHFWMTAACMKLLGVNEVSARLPAFLATLGLLVILWLVIRRRHGAETAASAVGITATCGVFWALAGAVATDMTLAATSCAATLCYMAFLQSDERRERTQWSLAVFFFLGLAFMTKGPVALILFGLPIFLWTLLNRQWQTLWGHAWLRGMLIFLVITVPWFALCELRNPGFCRYFFINENLLRFLTPAYGDRYGNGHIYPRGSAIVMMLLASMPWSLVALVQLWHLRGKRKWSAMVRNPVTGIALLGVVSITLFWCLARQLLITYLLPAVPLLAVWVALQIKSRERLLACVWAYGGICLVGTFIAVPLLWGDRSLKHALAQLDRNSPTKEQLLVFVRRTPYSAFFYARGRVVAHPKEGVGASVERAVALDDPCVLVFRRKYVNRVPPKLRDAFEVIQDTGGWVVCRPCAPASVHASAGHSGTVASRRAACSSVATWLAIFRSIAIEH
ncbi:MAG: glycosyltransferase family 39 protein [Lentisphaeria bacterium]|nr:glycosyltransferase family 39 protein [Lentisphaeria bacterium]